ncbi:hypothetical protein KCU90_g3721, partial [Aureobasidium melanogenum]
MPDVIQPAAFERKTVRREILDRWRIIDPAVEPRLDRVPISRNDVDVVTGHLRPHMAFDQFIGEQAGLRGTLQVHRHTHGHRAERDHQRDEPTLSDRRARACAPAR